MLRANAARPSWKRTNIVTLIWYMPYMSVWVCLGIDEEGCWSLGTLQYLSGNKYVTYMQHLFRPLEDELLASLGRARTTPRWDQSSAQERDQIHQYVMVSFSNFSNGQGIRECPWTVLTRTVSDKD